MRIATRPMSKKGEILPTELWRTKNPALYDPEDINFLFIVATDDINVVVYVYGRGLFSCTKADLLRVYERDIEEDMRSRLPMPEFEKWIATFNASKCKHGLPIFLEGKISINRECKECFVIPEIASENESKDQALTVSDSPGIGTSSSPMTDTTPTPPA